MALGPLFSEFPIIVSLLFPARPSKQRGRWRPGVALGTPHPCRAARVSAAGVSLHAAAQPQLVRTADHSNFPMQMRL